MPLRLMTYNVNHANPDVAGTIRAIEQADPDLLLLQETTPVWETTLARYPHRAFHRFARSAGGIATLAKLPLDADTLFPPPAGGAWFPAQRTVIATSFGPLQILNVHLRPAYDSGWVTGYLTTPAMREVEIAAHWAALPARDLPTIIAGDFNEEPSGRAIAYLTARGLTRVAPSGPPTWHHERGGQTVLQLHLDHVMIDHRLLARSAQVLDAGSSDHRPVIATIAPG